MEGSELYSYFLIILSVIGVFVLIGLQFVKAGYGMFRTEQWGITIDNRIGWCIMEIVIFISLPITYLFSQCHEQICFVFLLIFEAHYFQRSIIFPLLMNKSEMPIVIVIMSSIFNIANTYTQAGWLFYYHPENYYNNWLYKPYFYIGFIVFITGMAINIHSDYIIRHLRKPGEHVHRLPKGGLFDYVTGAQYFGEIVEWIGYSILTMSPGALVFAWFTFCNLFPRAVQTHQKYHQDFKDAVGDRKIIFPFIY